MPDLYQLSVGPIGATYYQKQFARFETLGKAVPSWNHGAAFFTLAWLILRKMWRPAVLYAGVLFTLVLLWMFALHARVPLQVEATVCLLTALLLCVVPGFLANGWFYNKVRTQTLSTLTQASSIGQARAKLASESATPKQLQTIAAVQAVVSIILAGLMYHFWDHASTADRAPAPSGPPALVIPSVASLQTTTAEPALIDPEPETPALAIAAETPAETEPVATGSETSPSAPSTDSQLTSAPADNTAASMAITTAAATVAATAIAEAPASAPPAVLETPVVAAADQLRPLHLLSARRQTKSLPPKPKRLPRQASPKLLPQRLHRHLPPPASQLRAHSFPASTTSTPACMPKNPTLTAPSNSCNRSNSTPCAKR